MPVRLFIFPPCNHKCFKSFQFIIPFKFSKTHPRKDTFLSFLSSKIFSAPCTQWSKKISSRFCKCNNTSPNPAETLSILNFLRLVIRLRAEKSLIFEVKIHSDCTDGRYSKKLILESETKPTTTSVITNLHS
ncbi:hypothetical protein LEP1GSC044_2882 [Leptospira kirschneri serovar Grippotyphosa str. RM52]|nr:hypothetical protein LEP1GSC044_2882 [Leptospira kirschneri serovar Grippotyphosa str. RM52]EKR07644.1 hypothetical protein LEP1GSC122_2622 [Leptospira kirschneri serovar Valbuzzi str. 200702274]